MSTFSGLQSISAKKPSLTAKDLESIMPNATCIEARNWVLVNSSGPVYCYASFTGESKSACCIELSQQKGPQLSGSKMIEVLSQDNASILELTNTLLRVQL